MRASQPEVGPDPYARTTRESVTEIGVAAAVVSVIAVNNQAQGNATEATVFGPFFVEGSPEVALGGDISFGAASEPCWVAGTVTGTAGEPLPGASIEVWEADARTAGTMSSTTTAYRRPSSPLHRR